MRAQAAVAVAVAVVAQVLPVFSSGGTIFCCLRWCRRRSLALLGLYETAAPGKGKCQEDKYQ